MIRASFYIVFALFSSFRVSDIETFGARTLLTECDTNDKKENLIIITGAYTVRYETIILYGLL